MFTDDLNQEMRDDRNRRLENNWRSESPFGKDRWKEDKFEPFNFNQLTNDFYNGTIESAKFFPDLNSPHGPHIDLDVAKPGENPFKYRIFDSEATQNLFDDIGPNWTGFGK